MHCYHDWHVHDFFEELSDRLRVACADEYDLNGTLLIRKVAIVRLLDLQDLTELVLVKRLHDALLVLTFEGEREDIFLFPAVIIKIAMATDVKYGRLLLQDLSER